MPCEFESVHSDAPSAGCVALADLEYLPATINDSLAPPTTAQKLDMPANSGQDIGQKHGRQSQDAVLADVGNHSLKMKRSLPQASTTLKKKNRPMLQPAAGNTNPFLRTNRTNLTHQMACQTSQGSTAAVNGFMVYILGFNTVPG
eukprot:scaffold99593_cov51-Prasinocladus_malaysianus.AAC.2